MLIFAIILSAFLAAVVFFDVTRFIIPNWVNIGIIAFYLPFLITYGDSIEWWWSLVVMLCFFVGGLVLFQFKVMGGGDIKLLVALSLWIGWQPNVLAAFGIWTAISGGILALFLLVTRWYLIVVGSKMKKAPDLPKLFRWNEPVPYGLAISYAFGYLLWTGQVFHFTY